MCRPLRGQARSHTGSSVGKKLVFGTVPSVGAKLARDSGGSACIDVGSACLFAGKPAPTLDLQWARNLCSAQFPLWEQSLLAIAVGLLASMLNVPPPSRASPLPHRFLVVYKISVHRRSLWEPSLLAMAVGLLASMLNVLPLSRASSLPHRFLVVYKISVHRRSLWEPSLLAMAVGLLASMLNVLPPSRASSLQQWDRSTTGRNRPAARPPREQALLPQVRLKQI